MNTTKTIIVIPTYDEKENAAAMVQAVRSIVPEAEMLFVDDNSPDGTGVILDGIAAKDSHVHVLHRPGKQGLGRAYVQGFQWALERGFELIVQMDCDFSHDPKAIPSLLAAAEENDLVLGSRYIGGIRVMNWPMSRLLLSTGASQYVHLVTGMPIFDPTGGFKVFHRKVLEALELDKITSNGYSFQIEMNHGAWMRGFKIKEVPIKFVDRVEGVSKMNMSIFSEAIKGVLQMRWASFFNSYKNTTQEKTASVQV